MSDLNDANILSNAEQEERQRGRVMTHAVAMTERAEAAEAEVKRLLAALSEAEADVKQADEDYARFYRHWKDRATAAEARLEALEGAAREMLKPFSDQLRARVALEEALRDG